MSDPADFVERFAAYWRAPSAEGLETLLAEDVLLIAPMTPTTRLRQLSGSGHQAAG